jgi:hypothetical protein
MTKWLWLALIPSLVFAASRPFNMRRDPVYVDVHPDKVSILIENMDILASDLATPGNPFEMLLEQMEFVRDYRYIILVLRPGSETLQRQLQPLIAGRGIEIGMEPWEADRDVSDEAMLEFYNMGAWPAPSLDKAYTTYAKAMGDQPCDVNVREDSLTILHDNVTVTREGLHPPGNPFERLVDQCEASGGRPLFLCKESGGDDLFMKLLLFIQQRAPLMARRMGIETQQITVLVGTPIEAQAAGKTPVMFECRNNQLFALSPDQRDQAIEEDPYDLLTGQDAKGYPIDDPMAETADQWFGAQLARLDPHTHYVEFLVRPDSFNVFRNARKVCWNNGLESSCRLLGDNEPSLLDMEIPTIPLPFPP